MNYLKIYKLKNYFIIENYFTIYNKKLLIYNLRVYCPTCKIRIENLYFIDNMGPILKFMDTMNNRDSIDNKNEEKKLLFVNKIIKIIVENFYFINNPVLDKYENLFFMDNKDKVKVSTLYETVNFNFIGDMRNIMANKDKVKAETLCETVYFIGDMRKITKENINFMDNLMKEIINSMDNLNK